MSRSHNRFLCPTCLDLQVVQTSEPSSATVTLACGHERPFALLPSTGVSVEHLDTPAGKRLFPVATFIASTAPNNPDAADDATDEDATDEEEETHADV